MMRFLTCFALALSFIAPHSTLYAANDENPVVFSKDPHHSISYKGDVSLRSITRENDEGQLQMLIDFHNPYHRDVLSHGQEKPYSLGGQAFYLSKAEERRPTTGFYGIVSEHGAEETPTAFFSLGTLTTIYETTEKPESHRLLNELFYVLGLTEKASDNDIFDQSNMRTKDNKGLVAVGYAFHPDLYNEHNTIKSYWKGLIACVKEMREKGETLPHNPNGVDQTIPTYLACITAGYDHDMLTIMRQCGFAIFLPSSDHSYKDGGDASYAAGIADFCPGGDRVLALFDLEK